MVFEFAAIPPVFWQTWLALLGASALDLLGLPSPLLICQRLLQRFAHKVSHPTRNSVNQQRISGGLALLVFLILIVGLSFGIGWFVYNESSYQALLLLCCLRFPIALFATSRTQRFLSKSQLSLARSTISPFLLRDCDNLSPLGVKKACGQLLLREWICGLLLPIFWFSCLGIYAALTATLTHQAARQWRLQDQSFAWAATRVDQVFQLPASIGARLLLCFSIGIKPFSLAKGQHPSLLATLAFALRGQLGGPVRVQGSKIRLAQVGPEQPLTAAHLSALLQLFYWQLFWLMFLFSAVQILQAI